MTKYRQLDKRKRKCNTDHCQCSKYIIYATKSLMKLSFKIFRFQNPNIIDNYSYQPKKNINKEERWQQGLPKQYFTQVVTRTILNLRYKVPVYTTDSVCKKFKCKIY